LHSTDYNDKELKDLTSAIGLLVGFTELDEKGLPTKKYCEGKGENEPRKAIARLLRNRKPLDSTLRMQLAALFDPNPEERPFSNFEDSPIERKVVFEFRKRGRPREDFRNLAIAYEVFEIWQKAPAAKGKMDAVIYEVARKFGISEAYVRKAIKKCAKMFERLYRI